MNYEVTLQKKLLTMNHMWIFIRNAITGYGLILNLNHINPNILTIRKPIGVSEQSFYNKLL